MVKKKPMDEARFIRVYSQGSALGMLTQIWVDKVTGVNYLFQAFGSAGGGLTPLLKADGTPVVTPISKYPE